MKVRQGFVSNSSSSSFIVALNKKPATVEEMQELLFEDEKVFSHPYQREGYLVEQISQTVFDDIENQTPLTDEQIGEELTHGWLDGSPDMDNFRDSKGNYDWDGYEKASNEHAGKVGKEFTEPLKDKEFYIFHYGDDDGAYFGALEHGDLFEKLPHYRINKH